MTHFLIWWWWSIISILTITKNKSSLYDSRYIRNRITPKFHSYSYNSSNSLIWRPKNTDTCYVLALKVCGYSNIGIQSIKCYLISQYFKEGLLLLRALSFAVKFSFIVSTLLLDESCIIYQTKISCSIMKRTHDIHSHGYIV